MRVFIVLLGMYLIMTTNGCVSYNQLVNYRSDQVDSAILHYVKVPELKMQPNDILSITVFGTDTELADPFNMRRTERDNFNNIETLQLTGYLIDNDGNIDFPVLGKIYLNGLTTEECKQKIAELLEEYLVKPVVMVRLLNFRVTVSGEVLNPGSFSVLNERISLADALALAGGMTAYANRTNILVLREDKEFLSLNRVNMQSSDLFTSDYYYLRQNDLIYVEPLKEKVGAVADRSDRVFPIISAFGTIAAIAIALFR